MWYYNGNMVHVKWQLPDKTVTTYKSEHTMYASPPAAVHACIFSYIAQIWVGQGHHALLALPWVELLL